MRSEGWLDTQQVRLVEMSSGQDSLKALAEGKVDGAAMTLDEVLQARASGLPLSVVMIFDISAGADMLVAYPGIKTLADLRDSENIKIPFLVWCAVCTVAVNANDSGSSGDVRTAHHTQTNGVSIISTSLKGRCIGFEQGSVGELMLVESLRAAGLTKENVTLVMLLPITQQREAWSRDQVDAVITFEPVALNCWRKGRSTFLIVGKSLTLSLMSWRYAVIDSIGATPARFAICSLLIFGRSSI
ncbi:MAG: ABC transporter substrate-binding protein [Deltaproteobacteria bacterium]|nr:ABC transporter substrate-binding protein [Deltaproteobacteria bacterium]